MSTSSEKTNFRSISGTDITDHNKMVIAVVGTTPEGITFDDNTPIVINSNNTAITTKYLLVTPESGTFGKQRNNVLD